MDIMDSPMLPILVISLKEKWGDFGGNEAKNSQLFPK
jgi:hypothetical protein